MPRTIISLTQEDKEWLAQRARAEHVPVTELVRRAIGLYRQRSPAMGARHSGPCYGKIACAFFIRSRHSKREEEQQ